MNNNETIIKYVRDYALSPGPRYNEQGQKSGEDFFNSTLKDWFNEAKNSSRILNVVLDGTEGYLSSFLDESFGRLVFFYGLDNVEKNLNIISNSAPGLKEKLLSWTFPIWEKRRLENKAPKNTNSNV